MGLYGKSVCDPSFRPSQGTRLLLESSDRMGLGFTLPHGLGTGEALIPLRRVKVYYVNVLWSLPQVVIVQ